MTSTLSRCLLVTLIGFSSCGAPRVAGCGPDFPNVYLANSIDELATLPALSFRRELDGIVGAPKSPTETPEERSIRLHAAERTEIRDILLQRGLNPVEAATVAEGYLRDDPPAELPTEFSLYARGARAWHANDIPGAVRAWRQLLELPPKYRHYRTVWAAYMIARAHCDDQPDAAIDAAGLARNAASEGFADVLELAADVVGWEARASLHRQDYARALRLYLQQYAMGDRSALVSIQWTLRRAFRGEDMNREFETNRGSHDESPADEAALRTLADDPQLRAVVTAWFAARGGPDTRWGRESEAQFGRWIACLADLPHLPPEEAIRWSWAAYQNGQWKRAQKLVDQAPNDAPAAEWVRAMLLLRDGHTDAACKHLARAALAFSTEPSLAEAPQPNGAFAPDDCEHQPLGDNPRTQLGGTRGVLALQRSRYIDALRLFMENRLWADAAYVAERVLTIEELEHVVGTEYPEHWYGPHEDHADEGRDLRHLLARRLVRAKKFNDAYRYFPFSVARIYGQYIAAVSEGWNSTLADDARGQALWRAAKLLHEHGMDIEGTELDPDYAIWDGSYSWPGPIRAPFRSGEAGADSESTASGRPMFVLGTDERLRREASRVPKRRYHYRYHAAELARLAADLLPNDDDLTAEILNTGGRWIAATDPEVADPFYQSLVLRCPDTDLGQAAAAKHWFVTAR